MAPSGGVPWSAWLGSLDGEDELVPNYWTLVANPDIYDIDRAVQELDKDTWTTKGRDLRAGDLVAIWRASGRAGGRRGIIALGEVVLSVFDPWAIDDGRLTPIGFSYRAPSPQESSTSPEKGSRTARRQVNVMEESRAARVMSVLGVDLGPGAWANNGSAALSFGAARSIAHGEPAELVDVEGRAVRVEWIIWEAAPPLRSLA